MDTDEDRRSTFVDDSPSPRVAPLAAPPATYSSPVQSPPKRLLVTFLVAGALLALLGGLSAVQGAQRGAPSHPAGAATATSAAPTVAPTAAAGATPTTPPSSIGDHWVTVAGLSTTPLPILAPSDPRVAYVAGVFSDPAKSSPQTLGVQRTDDSGATWHTFTLPVNAPSSLDQFSLSVMVSPLDAYHLILTVGTGVGTPCPTGSSQPCTVQYFSADGGIHWRQISLPVSGVLGIMADADWQSESPLRAQGTRLYALAGPQSGGAGDETQGTGRLVTSTDGGATWRLADTALPSAVGIADYMPAPTGNSLFAVTDRADRFRVPVGMLPPPDFKLWRSDDAGAHWALVHSLSFPNFTGMRVTTLPGATQPIVYLDLFSKAGVGATSIAASADGGRTWAAAPNQGIPQGWFTDAQIWGTLADGSVMMAFSSARSAYSAGFVFYSWKAGDGAWHQVASQMTFNGLHFVTITASGGGARRIWVQADLPDSWLTAYYDLP